VYFSIVTNGTLLTDRISDFLKKNNFFVKISIDGDAESQNANRVFVSGAPTYDLVIASIKRFLEYDRFYISLTVPLNNLAFLFKNYIHLTNSGIKNVKIQASIHESWKISDIELLSNEIKQIVDYFDENKLGSNGHKLQINRLDDSCYDSFTKMINLRPNGDIYICHTCSIYSKINKYFLLGNVYSLTSESLSENYWKKLSNFVEQKNVLNKLINQK
jgi:sulfatase maturation enzyme AslB (radical SAM superfamily)